jgi:hypothetical protein
MVIIIIISGIIVFGTIRISNYYHTENIEEISSSLKRFTQWRFERKSNVVLNVSKENVIEITGRDIANILDSILFKYTQQHTAGFYREQHWAPYLLRPALVVNIGYTERYTQNKLHTYYYMKRGLNSSFIMIQLVKFV